MIKEEEGAEEKLASSSDRELDGGDDLSHYSSCGGESEFDRYCSAGSAMGTPSFRGSSYQDSDLGSLRSFRLGGENANFKNFGADRVLSGYQESEGGTLNWNGKREGYVGRDADLKGNFDAGGNWGIRVLSQNENEGNNNTSVDRRGEGRDLSDEEDESSSRYEHSEGEDSMFGCGNDGEKKIDLCNGKNAHFCDGESERVKKHLVMNPAVAFGSDDWDDFVRESGENTIDSMGTQSDIVSLSLKASNLVTYPNTMIEGRQGETRGTLTETYMNTSIINSTNLAKLDARQDAKGVLDSSNQNNDMDELADYLGSTSFSGYSLFQTNKDHLEKEVYAEEKLRIGQTESQVKNGDTSINEVMALHDGIVLHSKNLEGTKLDRVQPKVNEGKKNKLFEDNSSFASPSFVDTTESATTTKNHCFGFGQMEDHFVPVKKRDFELNDFCDEIVNDMEDILLDSDEPCRSRLSHGTRIYQSHFSQPSRNGGSTASSSGTDYAYNGIHQPLKIDKIEVVGASQRKGDVSFSERLVGVQKYTLYKIRVWSGEDHWEVERRYRDFSTLYHFLKKQFDDHGWTLPSPWSYVERESRKLFGNASPNVIADRSILIQECLQSIICPKFMSTSLKALISFLSPSETVPDSPTTTASNRSTHVENLGKTISLVVETRPLKSMKQILDAQHDRCAGCQRNFDDGRTRVLELAQALGWGKPRLCEYSGQLFCSSCHNNDTALLPARVLHYWDFTRYPVSHMAKSFLDSIGDQPMLCVSAVNPFLFSKVPTLQHVANIRSRIRAMLPYVRCPFRSSIYKGLGSRSYLIESNDFFALKDLISLSKGVFSALPVMVETVSRKIQEHITEQCLICYDVGIPCSARQDCNNQLSLIFPFQEREVEKCSSCELVFHKICFKKLSGCPCGARFKHGETERNSNDGLRSENSNLNLLGHTTEPSNGLFAGFFSKVMPGRSQILRRQEPKRVGNVISMGSIPNTSL